MKKNQIYNGLDRIMNTALFTLDLEDNLKDTIRQSVTGYVGRNFRPRNWILETFARGILRLLWIGGVIFLMFSGVIVGLSHGLPLYAVITLEAVMIGTVISGKELKDGKKKDC
ncbi:MAG: hypothetical protein LBQ71_12600 [Hungatella sp.]|jgi:hypothetical protein|nr:hypothetical protein [Hungatella sp.]